VKSRLTWVISTAGLTLLIALILASYGIQRFGSIGKAIAYVRGERLLMDEPIRDLGQVQSGQTVQLSYSVTNWTGKPITFVGIRSSCTCAIPEVPEEILQDRQTGTVRVNVLVPQKSGKFSGALTLFTDDLHYSSVVFGFTAYAVEKQLESD
jgi:hypothetical protein